MDQDPTARAQMEELYALLHLLVRRMTRRAFATPRMMQVDVGNALGLLGRMEDFPRRALLRRALPDLLRELGQRRPDLLRYVVILEETVLELGRDLRESGPPGE